MTALLMPTTRQMWMTTACSIPVDISHKELGNEIDQPIQFHKTQC
jgi:hypothetical protein